MKTRRIISVLAAVVAWIMFAAMPASADVCSSCNGALVVNMGTSSHNILIFNGSSNAILAPGQVSERYTYWQDVDAFNSPHCDAQRYQSGIGWTTVYRAGVWYYITNYDSSSYSIRVAWC